MRIGILALQGAFLEHEKILKKLGVQTFQIRNKYHITEDIDGLILPGGESTAIYKLLVELDMFDSIKKKIKQGLPVFGTCAGLILLAKNIKDYKQTHFATMDICCKRNAYGSQLESFSVCGKFANLNNIPMVFIRAPYIIDVENNVEVLAKVEGFIVAARQGNQLVTAFHPELTENLSVHEYFLKEICAKYKT